jgi:steroid delta-isomerase-like uncharacterized protein
MPGCLAGIPYSNISQEEERSMSAQNNREIVRNFIEEFQGRRNLDAIEEYLHPDFINHTAPPGTSQARDGVRWFFNAFYTAFPDFHAVIHDQIVDGEKVVTRKTFHGTHRGEFFGTPPTGREMNVQVIDILQVADGKIIGHWGEFDQLGLMQQLGVIPAPEASQPAG